MFGGANILGGILRCGSSGSPTANSSRDQLGYRPYAVWLVLAVVSRVRAVCCIFYAPMPVICALTSHSRLATSRSYDSLLEIFSLQSA